MPTLLRNLCLTGYATLLLGAPALALSACVASAPDQEPSAADIQDDAPGVTPQTLGASCFNDCGCSLNEVCDTASSKCVAVGGFSPPPPSPVCAASCQCAAAGNGLNYCVTGACQASAPSYAPKSGSWYNPARSGWGLAFSNAKKSPLYTSLQVVWYTYKTSGEPVWYSGELAPSGTRYTGTMYSSTYSSSSQSTSATSRGTMTFTPLSPTSGTFKWTFSPLKPGDINGSEPVQYLLFDGAVPTPPLTGSWFAYTPFPSAPLGLLPINLNLFLDVQGSTAVSYVGLYDSSGQPTWVNGSGSSSSSGFTTSLLKVTGTNLYPGSTGTPSTSAQPVGSLTVGNINAAANKAQFSLALPASYQPKVTGIQSLSRQTN